MMSDGQHHRICLWGMPGVGKSTIGAVLAQSLGIDHFDLDDALEKAYGQSIVELIEKRGEPGFRALEEEAVKSFALNGNGVISIGGGTLLPPKLRAEVRKSCTVVTLWTSPAVLASRLKGEERSKRHLLDPMRPLSVPHKLGSYFLL